MSHATMMKLVWGVALVLAITTNVLFNKGRGWRGALTTFAILLPIVWGAVTIEHYTR
jgi:hypothetical protein